MNASAPLIPPSNRTGQDGAAASPRLQQQEGGFSHIGVGLHDVEIMLRTSIDNQIQDLMHELIDLERITGGPIDVMDRR